MKTSASVTLVRTGRRFALRGKAFTMLELLGVILILSFLVALVFPALNRLHTTMARRQAAADARALVEAVLQYRNVYGMWPLHGDAITSEHRSHGIAFGDDDWGYMSLENKSLNVIDQAWLLAALAATNDTTNPRRIRFFEAPAERVDKGRFLDPWHQPYAVILAGEQPGVAGRASGWIIRSDSPATGRLVFDAPGETAVAASWGEPATTNHIFSWSTR